MDLFQTSGKETAIITPMRRLVVVLAFLLLACQSLNTMPASPSRPSPPNAHSFSTPSAVPVASPVVTSTPTTSPDSSFTVHLHPDGPIYSGDIVSFEVIAPLEVDLKKKEVQVQLAGEPSRDVGKAGFGPYGIGGRNQATLTWAWNTRGYEPGDYSLVFSIQPDGPSWSETVTLRPADRVPSPEPQASWESVENECCVVHYITGTEAARDLPDLLAIANEQASDSIKRMGIEFSDPIPVTIIPRVLGHGGFAGDEIYVSYLDRNYAGNDFAHVVQHEMVHLLDSRLGGELRPSIFLEGLAVYLSGGHYKKEPVLARAAALLKLGLYIPLAHLADSFYSSQHEIGYLEGAALVQYLVNAYGWETFNTFYRDIHPQPNGKQSQAIDAALQAHFGLTLAQLEGRFKTTLYRQHINPDMYDDLRLTIVYYDTIRRYQQLLDPSAFFLTVWVPAGNQVRERGIVTDYLRHPLTAENILLENLLVKAGKDLRAGEYAQTEETLGVIDKQLDALEELNSTAR